MNQNWTNRAPSTTTATATAAATVLQLTTRAASPPVAPNTDQRVGPTVSLDSRPIVIPMVSAMFGFPVIALAVICALRYRARRARLKSHLKRARTPGVVYRAGHGHRDFGKARLKVMRDPPTFTELSVIGSRGPSSSSEESSTAGHLLNHHHMQHPHYHLQRPIMGVGGAANNNNNGFQPAAGLEAATMAAVVFQVKRSRKCCDHKVSSHSRRTNEGGQYDEDEDEEDEGQLEQEDQDDNSSSDSQTPVNRSVIGRLAFPTSPLEILTGTAGLEFTYNVVSDGS